MFLRWRSCWVVHSASKYKLQESTIQKFWRRLFSKIKYWFLTTCVFTRSEIVDDHSAVVSEGDNAFDESLQLWHFLLAFLRKPFDFSVFCVHLGMFNRRIYTETCVAFDYQVMQSLNRHRQTDRGCFKTACLSMQNERVHSTLWNRYRCAVQQRTQVVCLLALHNLRIVMLYFEWCCSVDVRHRSETFQVSFRHPDLACNLRVCANRL